MKQLEQRVTKNINLELRMRSVERVPQNLYNDVMDGRHASRYQSSAAHTGKRDISTKIRLAGVDGKELHPPRNSL